MQEFLTSEQFSSARYTYDLMKKVDGTYEKFSAKALYDSGKSWYEQKGDYNYEGESETIKWIELQGCKIDSGIFLFLSLRKNDNKRYETGNVPVPFNEGTSITLTGSEGSISVVITNITVSSAGTMTADIGLSLIHI